MDFEIDIQECLAVLKNGGIILYPTDTIWGIGCDATNIKAVEKIFQLKKRTDEKALIVLVSDEREIMKYVANADLRVFDYLQQQPRPTTVVYGDAIGLADNLIGRDGSVAIRICKEIFCKHLIKRFATDSPDIFAEVETIGLRKRLIRCLQNISLQIRIATLPSLASRLSARPIAPSYTTVTGFDCCCR